MRAVFCLYDAQNAINGINTSLLRLLPELQRAGIQVQAQFVLWASEERCTTLPLMRRSGIDCKIIRARFYTEELVRAFLRAVDEYQPDVFVPGNVVPALYAGKWARAAGIATVGMLHNDDIEYSSLQDEFVFARPDFQLSALVCVSQKLEHDAAGRKPGNTLVRRIPYIMPLPKRSASFTGDLLRMVYCGRIAERQKRISFVANAMCIAASKLPGVSGVIYGSGPDENSLKSILTQYGISGVRAAGLIAPGDMLQEWLNSHVCVLLSEHEGLPVSLLEAMAHGVVPVCSSMQSGVPELVQDNVTGLIANTTEEFVAAIERLRQEPGLWQRLSKAARNKIKKEFAAERIVAQWQQLCEELVKSHVRKPLHRPFAVKLPPVNKSFTEFDRRKPAIITRAMRKLRGIL